MIIHLEDCLTVRNFPLNKMPTKCDSLHEKHNFCQFFFNSVGPTALIWAIILQGVVRGLRGLRTCRLGWIDFLEKRNWTLAFVVPNYLRTPNPKFHFLMCLLTCCMASANFDCYSTQYLYTQIHLSHHCVYKKYF